MNPSAEAQLELEIWLAGLPNQVTTWGSWTAESEPLSPIWDENPEVSKFEGTKPQLGWVSKDFFDPSDAPDMIFVSRCAYCYTDPGTGTCCPRQIEASRGVSTFP